MKPHRPAIAEVVPWLGPLARHVVVGVAAPMVVLVLTVLVVEWLMPALDHAPSWRDSAPAQLLRVVLGGTP